MTTITKEKHLCKLKVPAYVSLIIKKQSITE